MKFWVARIGEGRQNRVPAQQGTGRAVAGTLWARAAGRQYLPHTHSVHPICLGLYSEALDNKSKMERKNKLHLGM